MYNTILTLHSLCRWLVLATLLIAINRSYTGWLTSLAFTKQDNRLRHITATIAHIQLILGLWLYFISPVISYFLHHYKEAVHMRQIRFFGMEHSLMMLVAIIIITFGSSIAKRKNTHKARFKTIAIWYTVALVVILINIPWPFSPMVARPWLRF
jgi:phosphoglycerol transferase MdoB-like AlkP superfamily enzyme